MRLDEIADDEAWFCKACRASKVRRVSPIFFAHFSQSSHTVLQDPPPKPPRGFFSELIYKAETENPTIFSLPADIKNWYRNGESDLWPVLSNCFLKETQSHGWTSW